MTDEGPPAVLEEFSTVRARLAALADDAASCARALGAGTIARRLSDEREKLDAEEFVLAVMGEFKRGKSTLVNALVGATVLPVAAVPLTSVLTTVRRGTRPAVHVVFAGGRTLDIDLDDLEAYTTERGNPANAKGVQRVEIEYPAAQLQAGVALVDTPGIGSVYEPNTAVTLEFLPGADAVLVVLSADQPATRAELEFLRRIRAHVADLFVVLNKIDLLAPSDLDDVVGFCRGEVVRALGADGVRLYAVSARRALEARLANDPRAAGASGVEALEHDVAEFLDRERGGALLGAARRRIGKCLEELQRQLDLRRQVAAMPLVTLDARIAEFERQSERIAWSDAAIAGVLADARRRLVDALAATHPGFVAARAPAMVRTLQTTASSTPRGRRRLIRALQQALDAAVQAALQDWAEDQAARLRAEVASLLERLGDHANGLSADVRVLVRDLFGADVAPTLELANFALDPPVAQVDHAFALMLDELPLLLPGPLARRLVRRRFIAAAPDELRRNLAAVTANLRQRFTDAERTFLQEFHARVVAMLASLREVLAGARDERTRRDADSTRIAAELADTSAALSALRERLADDSPVETACAR